MILDNIARAGRYQGLSPHFKVAFEYLVAAEFGKIIDGRHEVDGDRVFALVQTNELKPPEQCRWEAHRKYADIQCVIDGHEVMGRGDLREFVEVVAFDPAADVGFYAPAPGVGSDLPTLHLLRPGDFAVFLPQDVHMPLMQPASQQAGQGPGKLRCRKVVMKVVVG